MHSTAPNGRELYKCVVHENTPVHKRDDARETSAPSSILYFPSD